MRMLGVWGVPWLLAACATASPPVDPVRALPAQASADLSCPTNVLRIAPMGEETFGETRIPLYQEVQGCSMHVIYTATKAGYVLSTPQHKPSHAPDHVDVR
jgi:hypothetical protein